MTRKKYLERMYRLRCCVPTEQEQTRFTGRARRQIEENRTTNQKETGQYLIKLGRAVI